MVGGRRQPPRGHGPHHHADRHGAGDPGAVRVRGVHRLAQPGPAGSARRCHAALGGHPGPGVRGGVLAGVALPGPACRAGLVARQALGVPRRGAPDPGAVHPSGPAPRRDRRHGAVLGRDALAAWSALAEDQFLLLEL